MGFLTRLFPAAAPPSHKLVAFSSQVTTAVTCDKETCYLVSSCHHPWNNQLTFMSYSDAIRQSPYTACLVALARLECIQLLEASQAQSFQHEVHVVIQTKRNLVLLRCYSFNQTTGTYRAIENCNLRSSRQEQSGQGTGEPTSCRHNSRLVNVQKPPIVPCQKAPRSSNLFKMDPRFARTSCTVFGCKGPVQ